MLAPKFTIHNFLKSTLKYVFGIMATDGEGEQTKREIEKVQLLASSHSDQVNHSHFQFVISTAEIASLFLPLQNMKLQSVSAELSRHVRYAGDRSLSKC